MIESLATSYRDCDMPDIYGEFEGSRHFNQARMDRRAADALVGLAAGIAADGVVSQTEAVFLHQWLESNLAHLDDPVINLLYSRLNNMLADGVLDDDEAAELLETLRAFGGLKVQSPVSPTAPFVAPNDLPLNQPLPDIEWNGRLFVFTGVMAYGPRKECQKLVTDRGGEIGKNISKKTHYLVIGSIGNDQWRHSSYGLKIMKALELREAGAPIALVSEDHWQQALFG